MASFARRVQSVGLAALAVVAMVGMPLVLAADPQPLTLEQRIEYQRRIERIRWTHRIENVSGQHQPFRALHS